MATQQHTETTKVTRRRDPRAVRFIAAGSIIAVLSMGWWSDRGIRTSVSGPPGGQVGSEYSVLAPFWLGLGLGAVLIGIGTFRWLDRTELSFVVARAVCAGFAVVGSAWLLTFIRLAERGGWSDGRPHRGVDGAVDLPLIDGQTANDDPTVAYWQEAARHEASSATAFEMLAVELFDMRAPEHLVSSCWSAAGDERRHAVMCLEIAEGLNGGPVNGLEDSWTPSVDERRKSMAYAAAEAFVHGVVGEGFAVERLVVGAETANPEQAAIMRALAEDERRHVGLALATVSWCLEFGGRRVEWALRSAAKALPREPDYPNALRHIADGDRRRAGLLDDAQCQIAWTSSVHAAREELSLMCAKPVT